MREGDTAEARIGKHTSRQHFRGRTLIRYRIARGAMRSRKSSIRNTSYRRHQAGFGAATQKGVGADRDRPDCWKHISTEKN